jgi:hypothetical protein
MMTLFGDAKTLSKSGPFERLFCQGFEGSEFERLHRLLVLKTRIIWHTRSAPTDWCFLRFWSTPISGLSAIAIACGGTPPRGDGHTCALRSDGNVVCWGANNLGQLGIGSTRIVGNLPGFILTAVQLESGRSWCIIRGIVPKEISFYWIFVLIMKIRLYWLQLKILLIWLSI